MFGNNTKNWLVILKKRNKNWKILANFWKIFWYFLYFFIFKCSKRKLSIFEVLGEFWRGLEEPRSDKIYSSGNRGVKKGPGPRGSRDEEFLVASLNHTSYIWKIFVFIGSKCTVKVLSTRPWMSSKLSPFFLSILILILTIIPAKKWLAISKETKAVQLGQNLYEVAFESC